MWRAKRHCLLLNVDAHLTEYVVLLHCLKELGECGLREAVPREVQSL